MSALTAIQETMSRRGWTADVCLAMLAGYVDEQERYWSTPVAPCQQARPRSFVEFLAAVEARYVEIVKGRVPPVAPTSGRSSTDDVVDTDTDDDVVVGVETSVRPVFPPAESSAGGDPGRPVTPSRIELRMTTEEADFVSVRMGRPSPEPAWTQLLRLETSVAAGLTAAVTLYAGPRPFVVGEVADQSTKSVKRLPPRYDRIDGEYSFQIPGGDVTLVVLPPDRP